MFWIKPERITHALRALADWRSEVQDQGSRHLLPLLALLEKGAGDGSKIEFKETPHEFEFWDRYFLLPGGAAEKPYFNPITSRTAEKGYPHSNTATIRKNTFSNKWRAGALTQGPNGDEWTLAADYAEIFRAKVLKKGTKITRVPVVDLATVLFRAKPFDAGHATAEGLEKEFQTRFPQKADDYAKIFEFRVEDAKRIFIEQDGIPSYADAIIKGLVPEIDTNKPALPTAEPPTKIDDSEDGLLVQVQTLLALGTSGIIFRGCPGTGKSYEAQRIAKSLAKDPIRDIFRVQFHPSYGYEDFVEGYRPDPSKPSGFDIVDKTFVLACTRAREPDVGLVIVIVDEINRGDPARVFGELLTYIESDYRAERFFLPFSGREMSVPANLLLLGTMNPHDRSVSHVDAAFVRRFDHIDIPPSREMAEQFLEAGGGFTDHQVSLIGDWFDEAQKLVRAGLGHSFFKSAKDIDSLKLLWRYRIFPTAETLMELDDTKREGFVLSFEALLKRLEGAGGAA